MERTRRLFDSTRKWTLIFVAAAAMTASGCGFLKAGSGNGDGSGGLFNFDALPDIESDSGSGGDSLPNNKGLIGGTETAQRPEIGMLRLGRGACTGTLINSQAVLTAKHCVKFQTCKENCTSGGTYEFIVETSSGRKTYPLEQWKIYSSTGETPPGQRSRIHVTDRREQADDFWLNDDVAVVKLKESVPSSVAEPANVTQEVPDQGTDLTLWGYGCTERDAGGEGFGKKRFRDFESGERSNSLCPGDSGGPGTVGRDGPVVLVNSAYIEYKDDYEDGTEKKDHDLFGDAPSYRSNVQSTLSSWGVGSIGSSSGGSGDGQDGDGQDGDGQDGDGQDGDGQDGDGQDGDGQDGQDGDGQDGSQDGDGQDGGQDDGQDQGGSTETLTFETPGGQNYDIKDNSGVALYFNLRSQYTVQKIDVNVGIEHPRPTDLAIVLESPDGQRTLLADQGEVSNGSNTYTTTEVEGSTTKGRWNFEVYDLKEGQKGKLNSLELSMKVRTGGGSTSGAN